MVQRSPTMVVNVDPSAQLYGQSYLGDGPPIDIRDTLNSGMPLAVIKASHKLITNNVKKLDAALLQRLENVGFRLEFGEDGTGWPLKFRTRGGDYYFNVGCSELIADRKIRLIQATDIKRFTANGLKLSDGSTLSADLVVLATGYKGLDHVVASRFGEAVARRVGPIWGFDDKTQELRNMWTRTRQPGLWFTGGAFSQCRIYSRYTLHCRSTPSKRGSWQNSCDHGAPRHHAPCLSSSPKSHFGLPGGSTNLRPLGPMPLTCRTVSSSIAI
jgi:cation diffusion facilitator CzcD-associated flavoprotein CzcO